MSLTRPPLDSYRNGKGEWASLPFEAVGSRDGSLRVDIKFPVLGFLMDGEMTGYDLKRRFQDSVGFFYRVSDGSLYPALKKLARDKLVTMRTESRGKRARNVYAITARGRELFLKMLAEPSPPLFIHDEAQVKIYFGHHNPDAAMAHLRRMREFDRFRSDELADLIAYMKVQGASPFHKVLVEIGRQLSIFKAEMFAKLEKAMARELGASMRARSAIANRSATSPGARRRKMVQ
ncbi:MAG TPA: PadR family transcriptional regulator [Candidatus Binataceae bacterium]|nr:PadR family transcriptional regulator [Candidatus Binataceae bacterium]